MFHLLCRALQLSAAITGILTLCFIKSEGSIFYSTVFLFSYLFLWELFFQIFFCTHYQGLFFCSWAFSADLASLQFPVVLIRRAMYRLKLLLNIFDSALELNLDPFERHTLSIAKHTNVHTNMVSSRDYDNYCDYKFNLGHSYFIPNEHHRTQYR